MSLFCISVLLYNVTRVRFVVLILSLFSLTYEMSTVNKIIIIITSYHIYCSIKSFLILVAPLVESRGKDSPPAISVVRFFGCPRNQLTVH